MKIPDTVRQIPEIKEILVGADVIDIKTVESDVTLREFVVHALGYQPAWMTFLYGVRFFFVRLLGMKQQGVPRGYHKKPEDLPMEAGKMASFFKVEVAEEDRMWVAGASESHLTARLGVVVEPLEGQKKRFYVLTIVHYNRWTGPVYFNVNRPFHHVVVRQMMKAGAA